MDRAASAVDERIVSADDPLAQLAPPSEACPKCASLRWGFHKPSGKRKTGWWQCLDCLRANVKKRDMHLRSIKRRVCPKCGAKVRGKDCPTCVSLKQVGQGQRKLEEAYPADYVARVMALPPAQRDRFLRNFYKHPSVTFPTLAQLFPGLEPWVENTLKREKREKDMALCAAGGGRPAERSARYLDARARRSGPRRIGGQRCHSTSGRSWRGTRTTSGSGHSS
jgi:hypothetical protein